MVWLDFLRVCVWGGTCTLLSPSSPARDINIYGTVSDVSERVRDEDVDDAGK